MDKQTKEPQERLQKYLAKAGVASRRKAEELILQGRVKINGIVVTELGTKVHATDIVLFDDKPVQQSARLVYIVLYKPTGVVTTVNDPQGRRTVIDLLEGEKERVYPVGRLDYETSGLLVLTNDGELAHSLMHPRFCVTKHYEAVVEGRVREQDLERLSHGIDLDERTTAPAVVRLLGTDGKTSRVSLALHEGRNRQVRRMLEAVGHTCLALTRTKYGPLTLRGLRPGEWRYLREDEVTLLRQQTSPKTARRYR